ncbi:hypothetical protein QE152_g34113 [Popillia japonica]|uniref:Uncharacterized protein n=1 Tax=Popillia japonica TaxID=7064 RepID=A0AAW1IUT0_POPJA
MDPVGKGFEVNKSTIPRVKRREARKSCSKKKWIRSEKVIEINRTNFPGHVHTARNRVRQDSELRNRVAAKKPFLTADNKNQRIGFALEFDSELRNRVAAKKPFLTADNKNQRIGFALEFLLTTPEDDENLMQFLRNNPFESV